MKKVTLLALALVGILLTGCVSGIVPKTTIKGPGWSLSSPKDSTLAGFDFNVATNGATAIHMDSLAVKMNPDVITMSGNAQVQIINAVSDGIQKAVQAGMAAAAMGAKPPVPTK